MISEMMFTYQTRVQIATNELPLLEQYASHFSRASRCLFAALSSGEMLSGFKTDFSKRFGLTSRQYNSMLFEVQGKIDSIRNRRPELIAELKERINRLEDKIANLEKPPKGKAKKAAKVWVKCREARLSIHHKKRRLAALTRRYDAMKQEQQEGKVSLCFGGRKLYRAQFNLAANGYEDHADWLRDWQQKRDRQFMVVGSQDEVSGNQTCTATIQQNGDLTLRLRIPDALVCDGKKYVTIENVHFPYGHETIVKAIASSRRIIKTTKSGNRTATYVGQAISYRFMRDEKGWRVYASTQARAPAQETSTLTGVVGIDINADHLAVAETDRFGNLIHSWRMDLPLKGKTTDRAKALIGEAASGLADYARTVGKSMVREKLDMQKRKAEMETLSPAAARAISSFAYRSIINAVDSACFRVGVDVIEINPAYTSVMGAVMHAQRHGISTHMGAAFAIARRGLGLSEIHTGARAIVPMRNGGHGTFDLPVRNRLKHVWTHWAEIRKRLKAAQKEHYRRGEQKVDPPPLHELLATLCASRLIAVRTRDASSQHCSGNGMPDVPF